MLHGQEVSSRPKEQKKIEEMFTTTVEDRDDIVDIIRPWYADAPTEVAAEVTEVLDHLEAALLRRHEYTGEDEAYLWASGSAWTDTTRARPTTWLGLPTGFAAQEKTLHRAREEG